MDPESYNPNVIDYLATDIHQCEAVPEMVQENLNRASADEFFHYMLGMFVAQPGNEGASMHLLDGREPTNAETNIHFWRGVVDVCGQLSLQRQTKGKAKDSTKTSYAYPRLRLVAPPLLIDRLSEFVRRLPLPLLADRLQDALNPSTVYQQALERLRVEITGTDVQDLMGWLYGQDVHLGLHSGLVGEIMAWKPRKPGMFGVMRAAAQFYATPER
jgi:hypothetical protein